VFTTTLRTVLGAEISVGISASTATGHVRSVNEDSYVAEFPLFVVADGMGGHARGDLASQTAAAVLRKHLVTEELPTPDDVLAAIGAANDAVIALSAEIAGAAMSGTTLAGVVLVSNDEHRASYWMAFNIGDSRIYSWNGRTLEQLSVDHSAVQELIASGEITDVAARVHPDRNIVTRAVGASRKVEADVWLLPTTGSAGFVLCSDGLTKELEDFEIAQILAGSGASIGAVSVSDELLAAALGAGGRDNVTAVVVTATSSALGHDPEITRERDTVFEETSPRVGAPE
jgi:serine/threonine protein phosphatase PrpC